MKNENIQRRFGTVKLIFISLTLLWAFLLVYNAFGVCLKKDGSVIYTDSLSLKKEIVSLQQKLNYPNLVDRFYQDRLYKRAWVMQGYCPFRYLGVDVTDGLCITVWFEQKRFSSRSAHL